MADRRQWVWAVLLGMTMVGCASSSPPQKPMGGPVGQLITVQCTVTNALNGTPCLNEARHTCRSEDVRLRQIVAKNVIPATQGVDQTAMPITQYVTAYTCRN